MKLITKNLTKLRISHKLLISSMIFAIPLALLLHFIVQGYSKNIGFSENEKLGLSLLKPAEKLKELVFRHNYETKNYVNSNKTAEAKIIEIENQIDIAFAEFVQIFNKVEQKIKVDSDNLKLDNLQNYAPIEIQSKWSQLKANWRSRNDKNSELHLELLSLIKGCFALIADKSMLVIDPELDSYYMMEAVVITIPKLRTAVSESVLEIRELIESKDAKPERKYRLASIIDRIKVASLVDIVNSIDKTIKYDPLYFGSIEGLPNYLNSALKPFKESASAYIISLTAALNSKNSEFDKQELNNNAEAIVFASTKLWNYSVKSLEDLLEKRENSYKVSRFWTLLISFTSIIAASVLVFFISVGITIPLKGLSLVADEVASGKLDGAKISLEVAKSFLPDDYAIEGAAKKHKDELILLFKSFHDMIFKLNSLLAQVRQSGVQVTSATTQIRASIHGLEATVAEQAASTNEVNATSKEISASTDQLAGTMERVTVRASKASDLASVGIQHFDEIQVTMQSLLSASAEISENLKILFQKTGRISDVVTTITKVAVQTNLLSLNAAIEAEKAGEFGAGFAVVAREIRHLADQTAVSALDIEEMVAEMQSAVREGVVGVEKYNSQTKQGAGKISLLSEDLSKIMEHIHSILPEFESVNNGMQMQSKSAVQISLAMEQLNQVTSHTRDSLIEFREITERLNEAVNGLQKEVAQFSTSS